MKLRVIAAACSSALLMMACDSGQYSVNSVSGVVASGAPVVGTVITVTATDGSTVTSTPTDATGHYSITNMNMTGPLVLTAAFTDEDGQPGTLSSVVSGTGNLQANLNPLSALITQRLFAANLSAAPSAAQITQAGITNDSVRQTSNDVLATLQPLFAGLNVPAAQANPISAAMVADPSTDALDNLLDVTHANVRAGTLVVGADSSRVVVHIPAKGAIDPASVITTAAIQSLQAQLAAGTATPITNIIVVVGENRTFDSVFATYQPPSGQTVNNLLSQGIINADGTPGPNYALAAQSKGVTQTSYNISPVRDSLYATLPQPFLTGVLQANLTFAPNVPDPRFPTTLPNGPFQITKYVPYATATSATGDPVHRFFQMWQQTGGNNSKHDMFVWPAVTTGQGGATDGITASNPGQGGELMGFLNMQTGDAPYFNALAQQYAISDNYHQWILGGTGMNFFALATGDLPWYNTSGTVATPPANQIENPNPTAGTSNFYQNDGYQGGSYVNCSDATQPGVPAVLAFLQNLGNPSNCEAGKYYLVNNYNPPYDLLSGTTVLPTASNYVYPTQTVPTIAEALSNKGVSWKWYTGGRNPADVAADAAAFGVPVPYAQVAQYNTLGDPLVASSKVMGNAAMKARLAGLTDFTNDLAGGTLPAVSFVVPKNLDSGHPGYSVVPKYEGFLANLVAQVKANPAIWKHTAIIITTDEGGGNFDTGYIQNLDFFGDGPRIPLIVVSPYARSGAVDHVYHDHSSVLKFIERNWRLAPLSARSRDNLPNPVATAANPYKPVNARAIGDLTSMFAF